MLQKIDRNTYYSLGNYLRHGIFLLFYSPIKYSSLPFANYLRFIVVRLFSSDFKSKSISDGVSFWFPWKIKIGKGSSLNQGVILDGSAGITIGNNVRIAPYVMINSVDHEYGIKEKPVNELGYIGAEVIIEDNVWVGTHVIINKGVTVGKGSVIGAGSIVTHDIPAGVVAVGVPCRVVKKVIS